MKTVYLLVTIDTECDKKADWSIKKPFSFNSVLSGIPEILTPFFEAKGLHPTYLLSPEVIAKDECARVLRELPNCELGTHLHGEFVEPHANCGANSTDTPPCGYPHDLEREKLVSLTNLFVDQFGYAPKSFRAGRFGLSSKTFSFLEELAYTSDSSVTPFRNLTFPGACSVNYWDAPIYSYHTSQESLVRPGKQNLREIPVSLSIPRLQNCPLGLLRLMDLLGKNKKRILRRFGILDEPLWIRPFRLKPDEFPSAATLILDSWPRTKPAFINVMFHSVEVIPGASPYADSHQEVLLLLEGMEKLVRTLSQKYELVPVTMSEFCDEN